jgi:hypothetical protein
MFVSMQYTYDQARQSWLRTYGEVSLFFEPLLSKLPETSRVLRFRIGPKTCHDILYTADRFHRDIAHRQGS